MVKRIAKPACRWIGTFLLALAVAGWLDTPLIGKHGMIGADEGLSIGHAVIGAFLLVMSMGGESLCAFALYSVGAICIVFAASVLYQLGSYDSLRMFDSFFATRSAEYFHIVLGITVAIFGKMNTARQQLFRE